MPDEILWPLRGVSKDPNNLLTLGSDGQVMADKATTDAAYVKKAGDTMTGDLTVDGLISTTGDVSSIQTAKLQANRVEAGTVSAMSLELEGRLTAQTELYVGVTGVDDNGDEYTVPGEMRVLGDVVISGPTELTNAVDPSKPTLSIVPPQSGSLTAVNVGAFDSGTSILISPIGGSTASGTGYAISSTSLLKSYHRGRLGLNVVNPNVNNQLEVSGNTVLRGELDVTGNIASTGTAHSFAPNSIPASAIFGNLPRTIVTDDNDPDSAGQMTWDADFLYIHTGVTGWKKVALTAI